MNVRVKVRVNVWLNVCVGVMGRAGVIWKGQWVWIRIARGRCAARGEDVQHEGKMCRMRGRGRTERWEWTGGSGGWEWRCGRMVWNAGVEGWWWGRMCSVEEVVTCSVGSYWSYSFRFLGFVHKLQK